MTFSSLGDYYFIVFATYFGGYLVNLCVFNVYAIKILVYTYRTAMDLERSSHPHLHKVHVAKVPARQTLSVDDDSTPVGDVCSS